jgi:hypothetical protein
VNGVAERAIKSVRLELLNHVRVRDVVGLQWYLDEYRLCVGSAGTRQG